MTKILIPLALCMGEVTGISGHGTSLPAAHGAAQVRATPQHAGWLMGLLAAFGIDLLPWGTCLRSRKEKLSAGRGNADLADDAGRPRRPDRTDVAVMAAMTLVCAALSFWNLGGHSAPDTGWQPGRAGESVTVEFRRDADLTRIYYYAGINGASGDRSRFRLAARTPGGGFLPIASFTKEDVEGWKYIEVAVRTNAVRLTADTPGGRLNEIAFVEKGRRTPLGGLHIGDGQVSPSDDGSPEHLIDEQAAFEYAPSFRTGFYFDEIYFARTAWETLHGMEPYEWTHPPLGKLIIASGISLFGMNAFGWRFAGALFGVALVPLMYLFGVKLFRERVYAFCAAALAMLDFMRFAQSRLAVVDVFSVFFILLAYYFVLDLFPGGSPPPRGSARSIVLAGVAFGLGAACKWIGVYAGGGIAVLLTLRTLGDLRQGGLTGGERAWRFLARRAAVCLFAFGAIPVGIYLLAYLPYMALPGPGHDLAGVFRLQERMFRYHETLKATHPFSSPWWSWPLDLRPLWMYRGTGLPKGTASTIASFGNPAVWWLTIPAVAGTAVLGVRRRDARLGVVLTALLFQYVPWVGIHRLAFIYHFFSAVPFVILCIVAVLQAAEGQLPAFRPILWGYMGVTAGLFVVFYPVLSGLAVHQSYVAALRWLPTWLF